MNDINSKGVQTVKFDLFDVSGEKLKRIQLDVGYNPEDPMMNCPPDGLKLAICVGDNAASSTITLPLWFLSNAVAQLLQAHNEQKNAGLVGFDKPSIVGMN